ncbi:caspase-14-like isoform X1 [Urocitellus parryii]
MAFLVAGTLQAASQLADAQDSLGRKGEYSLQGSRVALTLSSHGVSTATVAALDCVFRSLGFENCEKRKTSVQCFLEELVWFREQLDAHKGPVGCALVALVAPSGQLRHVQLLVRELSHCGALRGCPKVFLLLSSGCGAALEPGVFLTGLRELCGRSPHWSLLRLLTEGFQAELAQFREKLDTCRSPVSCALVALMAHGGPQGQLLGADGQEVQPEALVQELSHCRALRGRPKIFLLQACRGGNRDAGVGPVALPWYWRWLRTPLAIPTQADVLQIHTDAQGSPSRGPIPGSSDQADILTVYAATEGCVAYRDEKGSDLVQTLVEVLRANPRGDLLELLTEVNRRVCELDVLGPDCNELRKACLEIRSSLRRRLCLQA